MHHIFPANEFPSIADYLENLIALTPTQHFTLNFYFFENRFTLAAFSLNRQNRIKLHLCKNLTIFLEICKQNSCTKV